MNSCENNFFVFSCLGLIPVECLLHYPTLDKTFNFIWHYYTNPNQLMWITMHEHGRAYSNMQNKKTVVAASVAENKIRTQNKRRRRQLFKHFEDWKRYLCKMRISVACRGINFHLRFIIEILILIYFISNLCVKVILIMAIQTAMLLESFSRIFMFTLKIE